MLAVWMTKLPLAHGSTLVSDGRLASCYYLSFRLCLSVVSTPLIRYLFHRLPLPDTPLLTHPLPNSIIRSGFVVFVHIRPFLRIGEGSMLAIELAQKVVQICIGLGRSLYELSLQIPLIFVGQDG